MRKAVFFLFFILTASQAAAADTGARLPDAPDRPRPAPASSVKEPATYAEALKTWRSVQDINAWIGRRFIYDSKRALALSETQRAAGGKTAILSPAELYARPRGVCVDLARFGKETAQRVSPQSRPRYLMIEFEPVVIKGKVLRRHWLVVYERDGGIYSFADSRRPGHVAGPFGSLAELVADYEKYRGRQIVAYRALEDFRKKALRKKKRKPAP